MKRNLIFSLALACLVGLGVAYAQQPEPKKDTKPEWKLEFTVFTGYFYNPSTIQNNATNFNSFYLNRAFIDFRVDFKNGLKLRVTPDVNPTTSGWILRLRHAFIDWSLIDKVLVLSGGITRTEWIGYVDDFVGIRYITTSPADKFGLRSSVDIGVSLQFVPIKGVEVFAGVFDGNGFTRGSDNLQTNTNFINVTKEVGTRALVAPVYLITGDTNFQNIVVALHTYNTIIAPYMTNAIGMELYGIGIGFWYTPVRLFVEYSTFNRINQHVSSTSGNYFGVLGKLGFDFLGFRGLSLVGAFYMFEPNVDVSKDEAMYYLGGVEYQFNDNLSVSFNAKIDQRKEGYRDFGNYKVDHQTLLNVDARIKL